MPNVAQTTSEAQGKQPTWRSKTWHTTRNRGKTRAVALSVALKASETTKHALAINDLNKMLSQCQRLKSKHLKEGAGAKDTLGDTLTLPTTSRDTRHAPKTRPEGPATNTQTPLTLKRRRRSILVGTNAMTIDHLAINEGWSSKILLLQATQLLEPDRPTVIVKGPLKIELGLPDANDLTMDIRNKLKSKTLTRRGRNNTMELEASRAMTDTAQRGLTKMRKATTGPQNVLSAKVILHTKRTSMRVVRSKITILPDGNNPVS
eukprot:4505093-Amphidinium_carterae.1